MEMGVTLFEMPQKPLDHLASRGENGQTDHDEENSLKNGEKKTQDTQYEKSPSDD
jgi:hypothetical protein